MKLQNEQKIFISVWQVAKILWLAQVLSNLSFGIPLVVMALFAANIPPSVIWQTVLFYFIVSLFVFVPFNGILPLVFLNPIKKILDKSFEEKRPIKEEELRVVGKFFDAPLRLSFINFIASFSSFILGIFILRLGLIPDLMPLIGVIVILGLAVGFVTCLIQFSLIYIFLENHFRPQVELLNRFYPDLTKKIKTRKFSIFWKAFFLAFSSAIVAQVSLGVLYLGRVIIYSYSPEDIKNALTYIGIVAALTLFYVVVIAALASRNLVYPIKKIISWADKIIKRETKEKIYLVTNDEIKELIEYLKQMHEELEDAKSSLEVRIRARTKELQELTDHQEKIIEERLKEIQTRAEELERFQKLAVGRELKMIELKKKVKELKEKLEKVHPVK